MKNLMTFIAALAVSSTVFASHPHQAVCVASGTYQDGSTASFLLQLSSERTYQNGDPNLDVHEYTFQARICDDDNDAGQCSTYKSASVITNPKRKFTLIGMKDANKTLFRGVVSGNSIKGKLVKTIEKDGKYVRILSPFESKLNCIAQTWVELKAEDDSNSF